MPAKTAADLAELLQAESDKLFDPNFDRASNCYQAKQPALTDAVGAHYRDRDAEPISAFAREMDVPAAHAQAWLAGEQKLYRPTCDAICRLLGQPLEELFDKLT